MRFLRYNFFIITLFAAFFSSCKLNTHNRMFQTEKEYAVDSIRLQLKDAERNYVIQKNDYLDVLVYTNGGERLIDPNSELIKQQGSERQQTGGENSLRYLVRENGLVKLPMIGDIYLEGMNLNKADSILQIAYAKFYEDVFVITKVKNKRVVVLGPSGGKVLPLENENISVIEILALYGGLGTEGKAYNIRLIRGDLKNPDVSIIDLSTIEGMKQANLNVQPNDIIYIENVRRVFSESLKEISPLVGIIVGLLTLYAILLR